MGKNIPRGSTYLLAVAIAAAVVVAVFVMVNFSPSAEESLSIRAELLDVNGKVIRSFTPTQSLFGAGGRSSFPLIQQAGVWIDPTTKTVILGYRFVINVVGGGTNLIPNSPISMALAGKIERRDGYLTNPSQQSTSFSGSYSNVATTDSKGSFVLDTAKMVSHQTTTPVDYTLYNIERFSATLPDRAQVTSDRVYYVLLGQGQTYVKLVGAGGDKVSNLNNNYYVEINYISGEIIVGITGRGESI